MADTATISKAKQLAEAGHYASEIIRVLGISRYLLHRAAEAGGFTVPSQTDVKRRRIANMCQEGLFLRDIGETLGRSRGAVRMFCAKHGIEKNIPPRIGPYRPSGDVICGEETAHFYCKNSNLNVNMDQPETRA